MTRSQRRHKKRFFRNVWSLEKGTIRHIIAQQTLVSLGDDPHAPDYERFTDNGDMALYTLYEDTCQVNRRTITREQRQRLLL